MNRNKRVKIKSSDSAPLLFYMAIMVRFYSINVALSSIKVSKELTVVASKSVSKFVDGSKVTVISALLQFLFLCKSFSLFIKPLPFSRDGVSVQTNPRTAISWINLHFYKNPEPVVYMLQVLNQSQQYVDEDCRSLASSCIDAMQNYRLHCNEENI